MTTRPIVLDDEFRDHPMHTQIVACIMTGCQYARMKSEYATRADFATRWWKDIPSVTRCPVCTGETQIALRRELNSETGPRRAQKAERGKTPAVLLDNIRSAWNVGSILRSAEGFGFSHAYLCGITPTADNEAVTKTSLGAEDSVPWSYHKDAVQIGKRPKV